MKRKDEDDSIKLENSEEVKEEESTHSSIKYSVANLQDCKSGTNSGSIYIGKLVLPLKKELDVPI